MNMTADPYIGVPFLQGLCADLRETLEAKQPKPTRRQKSNQWQKIASMTTVLCCAAASALIALLEVS